MSSVYDDGLHETNRRKCITTHNYYHRDGREKNMVGAPGMKFYHARGKSPWGNVLVKAPFRQQLIDHYCSSLIFCYYFLGGGTESTRLSIRNPVIPYKDFGQ